MVIEINKKFILFGKYKDTGKTFICKNVWCLTDNRDVLYLGLLPTVHYFASSDNLEQYKSIIVNEHKIKDLKNVLKTMQNKK